MSVGPSRAGATSRITISLTRYNEPGWLLEATLASLARQRRIAADVLLLDQAPDAEVERRCADLTSDSIRFRYVPVRVSGLSAARNRAIQLCDTNLLLFIDADAVAEIDWATELAGTLERADAGVAGGRIVARWHKRPLLIARSSVVKEQYSLLDLGPDETRTHKIVGAGFGLHRGRLGPLAHFDEALGRRPGGLMGGEEMDLCDRVRDAGLSVYYNGRAVVQHQIVPERISYRWIMRRLYYGGLDRAISGTRPRPTHAPSAADYVVAPVILPAYLVGFVRGMLARRR